MQQGQGGGILKARPTSRIHLGMLALAMLVAILLYLDRICLSTAAESVKRDLSIASEHWDLILSAFFLTYALAQVPAGWLGDRYGARWVLAAYIVLWSATTGLMGFATGWLTLVILRLGCGLFEAGAYPVCAGIVRRWIPLEHRGLASSLVAIGGRLGGALAPIITVQLMLMWTWWVGELRADAPKAIDTSWRPAMIFYGVLGVVIAAIFARYFRDDPAQHPKVSSSELAWIRGTESTQSSTSSTQANRSLWHAIILHKGLWLNSFVQFAANFGWAFLVTLFPTYLKEVHQSSLQSQGFLQSLPLVAGILGLLAGGRATDLVMRRWGMRWGRSFTVVVSRILVGIAFVLCPFVDGPVTATVCMAIVGFSSDFGNAACWAYGQDIGKKYAGTVLGWMNMWGNLGAFASPLVMGALSRSFGDDTFKGWLCAFVVCAIIQVVAAICAFFIDAQRPLDTHSAASPS